MPNHPQPIQSKFEHFLRGLPDPYFFDLSRVILQENLVFSWDVVSYTEVTKLGLDVKNTQFFDLLVTTKGQSWLARYTPIADHLIVMEIDSHGWKWGTGAAPNRIN